MELRPSGSGSGPLAFGALLGLFAYATYDLTNLATLKGFPLRVVVVDLAWGVVLTGPYYHHPAVRVVGRRKWSPILVR